MGVGDWIALAGLIVGSGVLGAMWRKLQGVPQMVEDWRGRPRREDPMTGALIDPGRPSMPGRMAGVEQGQAKHDELIAQILKELSPNSGTSLRDAINRLEKKVGSAPPEISTHA